MINWNLAIENRVKDLSYNKSGRYGIIYQWQHKHREFFVTVKRTSEGTYKVLKGESSRTMMQAPVESDFLHSNYEDAEERAREWMREHPEPVEEEFTI